MEGSLQRQHHAGPRGGHSWCRVSAGTLLGPQKEPRLCTWGWGSKSPTLKTGAGHMWGLERFSIIEWD